MNYPSIGFCPKCGKKDCLIEIDDLDINGERSGIKYKVVECPECGEEIDVDVTNRDYYKHKIIDGLHLYRFQCNECNKIFWLT